jgi:hypothetical protein
VIEACIDPPPVGNKIYSKFLEENRWERVYDHYRKVISDHLEDAAVILLL